MYILKFDIAVGDRKRMHVFECHQNLAKEDAGFVLG